MVGQGNQRSFIDTEVESSAMGQGGNITIEAKNLSVRDGGLISTSTYGQGNAGNMLLSTTDSVEVTGYLPEDRFTTSSIRSSVGDETTAAKGNAGSLTVTTKRLSVTGGSDISTSVYGTGNAGDMRIYAEDFIELDGDIPLTRFVGLDGVTLLTQDGREVVRGGVGGLTAQIESLGEIVSSGRGGNIFIETGRLNVSNGSKVQVASFGEGDAGNLFIRANEINVFSTFDEIGGFATSINAGVSRDPRTVNPPKGNGGNLTIETKRLSIRDSIRTSEVTVNTYGEGNAGKGQIYADVIEVIGERAFLSANVTSTGTGKAGDLILNTRELNVLDSGRVSVSSDGKGIAGNLEVNAQTITLDNQAAILGTTTSGQGGNITLNVGKLLLLRRGSTISTTAGTAQAGGNGGNVTINGGFIIAIPKENSDITANAFSGAGGNITISSPGIFGLKFRPRLTEFSDITASSDFGNSGTIQLNSPDTSNLQNGLTEFPQTFTDTTQLLANSCIVRSRKQNSRFVITGSGGLPLRPGDAPLSPFPTGEVRVLEVRGERGGQGEQGRQGERGRQGEERGERDEGRGMRDEGGEEIYVIQNSMLDTQNAPNRPWKLGDPIVEPQGVYRLANGDLVMSRECK